jgi:uncharacterized Zn-finger protein
MPRLLLWLQQETTSAEHPKPLQCVTPRTHGYPKFHNQVGLPIVRIGCREFKCIGDKPPQDHPHILLKMGDASEIVCPYCSTLFRFDPSLAHTMLLRQIVLTVTGTELNCSSAASLMSG